MFSKREGGGGGGIGISSAYFLVSLSLVIVPLTDFIVARSGSATAARALFNGLWYCCLKRAGLRTGQAVINFFKKAFLSNFGELLKACLSDLRTTPSTLSTTVISPSIPYSQVTIYENEVISMQDWCRSSRCSVVSTLKSQSLGSAKWVSLVVLMQASLHSSIEFLHSWTSQRSSQEPWQYTLRCNRSLWQTGRITGRKTPRRTSIWYEIWQARITSPNCT